MSLHYDLEKLPQFVKDQLEGKVKPQGMTCIVHAAPGQIYIVRFGTTPSFNEIVAGAAIQHENIHASYHVDKKPDAENSN